MDPAEFVIVATRLWPGERPVEAPLAIVDLDQCSVAPFEVALPPCPVIGVGNRDHWLAEHIDAIIEQPVTLEQVTRQVMAMPLAAAAVVQLLRMLPALDVQQGLVAESIAYAMLQGSAGHRRWLAQLPAAIPASLPGKVDVRRDGEIMTLILARPEAGNAIDRTMRDALFEALSLASLDASIHTIALRAEGKAFSLGADLAEFGTTADPATAHDIRARTLPAYMAARCGDRIEAHVQGACIGAGLELAAYAARITATPNAWFQLPELAMGILPGAGGCVSLTRRIGRQRTALMILSGKRIAARQALDWGLVDALVDDPA